MTGAGLAHRLLHPLPGLAWTEVRAAAVGYVSRGWPVRPGTYQLAVREGWLGKRGATGLEPVVVPGQQAIITCPEVALETWTQRPYSVLLACGTAVSALEMMAEDGAQVAALLAEQGHRGPICVTPSGSWLLLVRCDSEPTGRAAPGQIQLHGPGRWVPLPPTACRAVPYRWRVTPGEGQWVLPPLSAVDVALSGAVSSGSIRATAEP